MGPAPLVGRDHELHELDRRLRSSRLVTVVGPGGVGKTALAGAGSQRAAPMFPMGVRYVDLTRVEDEGRVSGALAAQLGFDSFDALLSSPADRPVLLVVDNCEHLLDAAAHWLVQVLGSCQQSTILATSRSPLELPGESVLPVAPLAVDGAGTGAASSASVQLFLVRSREAGAAVEPDDLPAVAELCRRVDGLPLAIEIAAARSRTMSVPDIVRRLDANLDVLDRPRFRGDPRHRSVADTVRWSHDLLSREAAELLEDLAVFAGPFGSESARAVAAVEPSSRFEEVFDELVYASLVTANTAGPETRYRLLETVRRFALDRARRRGGLEAAYDRLADHAVASVQGIAGGGVTSWTPSVLRELIASFDDLAEALRWCTAHDTRPDRAYVLCAALGGIVNQGRADDIVDLARSTLARWPAEGSQEGARCVAALATAACVTGHPEQALELVASTTTSLEAGMALVALRRVEGQARRALGDTDGALVALRDGARVGHELGMLPVAIELEIAAAVVVADRGDVQAGVAELHDLVGRAAASGSVITESWARAAWSWVLLRVDPVTALAAIEPGLSEARRIDYPIAVAVNLRSLAYARFLVGDLVGALDAARLLLDDLLARGALSNARLLVDVTAVLAHHYGHPAWATLAATVDVLPVTTLSAGYRELVPLPRVEATPIGKRDVIATVRTVLEELTITASVGPVPASAELRSEQAAWIERRGETAEIGFAGRVVSMRHSKGLDDVIRLIEAGGREVHCLDLARASVQESSTGPVLDDAARRQYERRIRELQEEIEEAEHDNDLARLYKRQVELDTLIDHLSAAMGVGGTSRSVGGTVERARSAVTHRIRAAIRQVEKLNPHLGRHLRHAVNTGTYCSYRPEQPTNWRIT